MTLDPRQQAELHDLVDAVCENELSPAAVERLESLLLADDDACRYCLGYLSLHGALMLADGSGEERETSGGGRAVAGSPTFDVVGGAVEPPHQPESRVPSPEPRIPSIVLDLSPTSHYPLSTGHFFVGGPVFSYMVATVILGVMLLGAWAYKITHYYQIAEATSVPSSNRPELVFVGRITGMVDCRWADPETEAYAGASVPLDRKYALASGLMEITYKTGAKVILEGPCTYEVESGRGGYLAQGKLTARIEERREKREESAKPQAANPKSPNLQISKSPNPKSLAPRPPSPAPLFSVRTPTAVVTDLGTEFGVEVSEEGNTTSHVFRGTVKVQVVSGVGRREEVVLGENETARVVCKASGEKVVVSRENSGEPPRFIRLIPRPRRNYIDLADIVAGGDGFGRARDRGINPVDGSLLDNRDKFDHALKNDGYYHPVEELPLIDGVFIPDGGQGPIQIDSDGHKFNNFPDTTGLSWHFLWSGQLPETAYPPMPCWLGMANYAGPRHSVLSMPPNKGVTFDLEAIRRKHADTRLMRFTAVAGNTEMRSTNHYAARVSADLWVFVDGRLRFSKRDVNTNDGEFMVDISLTAANRFLTLAATDAGNSTECDWTIFGDPRLEIKSTIDNQISGRHETQPSDAASGKEGVPMK